MKFSRPKPSSLYSLSAIVPVTILLAMLLLALAPFDVFLRYGVYQNRKLGPLAVIIRSLWLKWILWTHGIKIKKQGHFKKMNRGLVIAANHQSLLDIPVIFSIAPPNTVFLAKRELFFIPFFGWAAWLAGTQFVDRKKGARDPQLDRATNLLKRGFSLVIFPEGTRSPSGELLPFKKGAAVMSINAGVDLQPVAVEGSQKILPKKSLAIGSGEIQVSIGEIISTEGWAVSRRDDLTQILQKSVGSELSKLRSFKTA